MPLPKQLPAEVQDKIKKLRADIISGKFEVKEIRKRRDK